VRRCPTTEDHGKFGVKLGERRAKRALAGWVRTTPKVAGDGKRDMRNEVSEAEITHRLSASSPDLPGTAGVPIGGTQD
jgi:hypothetical protein